MKVLRSLIPFFLFMLLPSQLFSCALCALYTPSATVNIALNGTPNHINSATFEWHFTQDFITTLQERYDENNNKILDPNELKRIEIIFTNYIAKKQYLTAIEYTDNSHNEPIVTPLKIHVTQKAFFLDKNALIFKFTTDMNQPVHSNDEFSFSVEDNEGFFRFLIHGVTHTIDKPFALESNLNSQIAFIRIIDTNATTIPQTYRQTKESPKPVQPTSMPQISQKPSLSWLAWLKEHLSLLQKSIQESMSQLKTNGSAPAYILFLATSFLYGLLHAAGPGHGKTLVSSYLFSSQHRYSKALSMALLIGITHTFAALGLTLIIYAIFDLFFTAFFNDVTFYTTKISALVIIAIVLYLGYQKLQAFKNRSKSIIFSAHPFTCNCAGCSPKSQSSDWGVVLSASIVPCPGTVAIFIFALSAKTYLLGFLAAFAMSFGMSSVIAIAAFSTLFVKKRFQKKAPRFLVYSEFLGLGMMLSLGILLLVL